MNILYSGLHDVLMILLKSTDTRECVLQFLAEVINANASRGHIQVIIPNKMDICFRSLCLIIFLLSVSLSWYLPFLLNPPFYNILTCISCMTG